MDGNLELEKKNKLENGGHLVYRSGFDVKKLIDALVFFKKQETSKSYMKKITWKKSLEDKYVSKLSVKSGNVQLKREI